jgi:arginine decarboxylase
MSKTEQIWSPAAAADLYGIEHWGAGNYNVNQAGEACIRVDFAAGPVAIPLPQIVRAARERGYALPLLIRIDNLLDRRLQQLYDSFEEAIRRSGYQGNYRGVFPVKVNQQSAVIEEICRFGASHGHGLEAGSKAELLLCMANLNPGGLLICNGYKDRDYIDLGLWATKLGLNCYFVIESPTELPLLIERSRALQIRPQIGLRVKVAAQVGGLWTETSGDRSSFGLSADQLLATVDRLRDTQLLDCVKLLHCHLGSQIPKLADITVAVREAGRFFADLVAEEVPLEIIDLGGGLAVDYIGNKSAHSHSRDYSLADYCHCLTTTLVDTFNPDDIPHPTIVTESGRATVAHTSVLLFNILDVMRAAPAALPRKCPTEAHPLLREQFVRYQQTDNQDPITSYRQALTNRDQLRDLFRDGSVRAREYALGEELFLTIAGKVHQRATRMNPPPAELSGLGKNLADIYYGNFSVFQSLPDCWAIGQRFPVMPIQRLDEYPSRQASIADLTCDCDGKLDRFILANGESATLPVHPLKTDENYILGVFLMGAYQETLGDLHNLFGDTNVLSIRVNADGGFDITREQEGDRISEILASLEYNPTLFQKNFRVKVEEAVRQGGISVAQRRRILAQFSKCLNDHSYLNLEGLE